MLARFFRHDSCSKKLRDLLEKVETVEGQLRRLDADFRDLWDRFLRFEGRLKKRAAREDTEAAPEKPEPVVSPVLLRRTMRI